MSAELDHVKQVIEAIRNDNIPMPTRKQFHAILDQLVAFAEAYDAEVPTSTYCCELSWKAAKDKAWAERDLNCGCDHNEYCEKCFPHDFRKGGKWSSFGCHTKLMIEVSMEAKWISDLRYELMMSKNTHNFTFSRDEVMEIIKPEVTDNMAYAFHHALTDGDLGADEVEEIKKGLRAALGVY